MFRAAFNSGNQERFNAAIASIQQVMQEVYDFHERNQYVENECTKAARRIFTEYNRFTRDYGKFAAFPSTLRMSPEALHYLETAETTFKGLLSFVIKTLSEPMERDKP